MGIDLSKIKRKPRDFAVWPEHEDAVLAFLRCQTQWRPRPGDSGVMGLDYSVVLSFLALYAVADVRRTMEEIQIMEGHARDLINRSAAAASKAGR